MDEPVDEPAQLAARPAPKVSRSLRGRKVDVLVKAPNLTELPIHAIALAGGIRLRSPLLHWPCGSSFWRV